MKARKYFAFFGCLYGSTGIKVSHTVKRVRVRGILSLCEKGGRLSLQMRGRAHSKKLGRIRG